MFTIIRIIMHAHSDAHCCSLPRECSLCLKHIVPFDVSSIVLYVGMALAQIRARIGVIRLAMERYRDTDRWYSFSHVQSTALISSLRSLNSDADAVALADLCQEAGLLQWAGQDGERLLEALSEAMTMQDTAVRLSHIHI